MPGLRWLSRATSGRDRSCSTRFRTLVLSVAVLFVVATPGFLHAICGLEAALWQLRREALRTQNANYSFSGLPTQVRLGIRAQGVCSACHLASYGGPRNELGTALNTLLTTDDRADAVRQRELGRRVMDLPVDPTIPNSPTFGQWFGSGQPLAAVSVNSASDQASPPPRALAERLDVDEAERRVRAAEAEARFGILQIARASELSAEVAAVLASFRGEALILDVQQLSVEVAAALAGSEAETLWLPTVTAVSDEVAAELARFPGRLVMTGLASLDSVALAEKLATHPRGLSLPYLREIGPEVAQALARAPRRLTLAALTRPSLEVQDRLAETAGALSLPSLQTLDSLRLAEKLGSGLVLLPVVEALTVPQVQAFLGVRGQESFFGGVFLPLSSITPEVAVVLAASPKPINLILGGREWVSDDVFQTLLTGKPRVTLADVEALSRDQIRSLSAVVGPPPTPGGVVQLPSLSLPQLQSLDSALLAETLGQPSKFSLSGVQRLSPSAALAIGNVPNVERQLSTGQVDVLLANLTLPDLKELPLEVAEPLFRKKWYSVNLPSLEEVSLEVLERLAPQTSSLELGITTLPEAFVDVLASIPGQPEGRAGILKLPRLQELSPEVARRLVDGLNRGVAQRRQALGDKVALPKLEWGDYFHEFNYGWTPLSPEVARELARFEGSLTLHGLGELPDEAAVALAAYKGPYLSLFGPGAERLSPVAAAALAKIPGVLWLPLRELDSVPLAQRFASQLNWTLSNLETVSPDAGTALANYRSFFDLRALTAVETVDMAARFVEGTTTASSITLPALQALSPAAAERMVQGPKKMTLGLRVLDDPETARALARRPEQISLPRLRAVTPTVRDILSQAAGISMPPLESLYLLSEAEPTNARWVQELGAADFTRREAAYRELAQLGIVAKAELLVGLQAADPEVRWRSAQLWQAAHAIDFEQRAAAWLRVPDGTSDDAGWTERAVEAEFPGWTQYRRRFGYSLPARQLFVEMQRSEPLLLAQWHANPIGSLGPLTALAERLRLQVSNRQQRRTIQVGSVATLWFLSSERAISWPAWESETLGQLTELPRVQDDLQFDSPLRQLWLTWRRSYRDLRPARERLIELLRYELRAEAEEVAREILCDADATAESRQYALLTLADSQDPADLALMSRYLEDPSPLGVYLAQETVIKSELRDIALAAVIHRSGADPREFGFRYLKPGATLRYSPLTLGFVDLHERQATFAKWSARPAP